MKKSNYNLELYYIDIKEKPFTILVLDDEISYQCYVSEGSNLNFSAMNFVMFEPKEKMSKVEFIDAVKKYFMRHPELPQLIAHENN